MTREVFRNAIVAALAFGFISANEAMAQDPPNDGTTTETGDPAQPGGEVTTGTGVAAGKVGPFSKDAYPDEVIFRPLTLPAQMFQISPQYSFIRILDTNAGGIDLGVDYGITDQLQVGVSTGFAIHPDADWGKSIGIGAAFLVIDQDKLDMAPGISTALNFEDGADLISGLNINATTRFLINDMIFIQGGQGLIGLGFSGDFSMSLHLNAGVGFQVMPKLALGVDFNFFNINVTPSGGSTFIFADYIPLTISALYAVNKMIDVKAFLSFPDLENAGDLVLFGIGANVRI